VRQAIARIVDVKQRREDSAQIYLRQSRLALESAAQQAIQAKEEIARYASWRVAEEVRLWDGIENKPIKVEAIDAMKAEIGLLRGQEHVLVEKADQAERARLRAKEVLAQAEQDFEMAQRARSKFEDLAEVLDAEWRQEQDRKEEAELDELAESRFKTVSPDEDDP
jgi:flagellar biosynthesis chaperone FliJ